MSRKTLFLLPCLTALPACEAGHLGNPLLLPVSAVSAGFENAGYNARRKHVKDYVSEHHAELMQDVMRGGGPHLTQAYALARVAPARHALLTKRIAEDAALYRSDAEALTVALMVHGA